MKTFVYQPRTYRDKCTSGSLVPFTVTIKESDLYIHAVQDLSRQARTRLVYLRNQLLQYIDKHMGFAESFAPIPVDSDAPSLVKDMAWAADQCGVGPMAAVAGAISEDLTHYLGQFSNDIVVENGGDIYAKVSFPLNVALYAGTSPLSMKIGIEVPPYPCGVSICTSSGTVGHSFSYGKADAVTIIAHRGGIADAAATAVGNRINSYEDIGQEIDHALSDYDIIGIVVIMNDYIGIQGQDLRLYGLG
jgi:ApbE superfamily uncharacterized protein (UPF0280 family)